MLCCQWFCCSNSLEKRVTSFGNIFCCLLNDDVDKLQNCRKKRERKRQASTRQLLRSAELIRRREATADVDQAAVAIRRVRLHPAKHRQVFVDFRLQANGPRFPRQRQRAVLQHHQKAFRRPLAYTTHTHTHTHTQSMQPHKPIRENTFKIFFSFFFFFFFFFLFYVTIVISCFLIKCSVRFQGHNCVCCCVFVIDIPIATHFWIWCRQINTTRQSKQF